MDEPMMVCFWCPDGEHVAQLLAAAGILVSEGLCHTCLHDLEPDELEHTGRLWEEWNDGRGHGAMGARFGDHVVLIQDQHLAMQPPRGLESRCTVALYRTDGLRLRAVENVSGVDEAQRIGDKWLLAIEHAKTAPIIPPFTPA